MKFELLPNEILIECIKYLNIFDIFHSFDQLNYRFYQLIRNIPLYLNFRYNQRITFSEFRRQISSDSDIRQQIYSLRLSNKDTCNQTQSILSCFSSNEFSQLRSLTLVQVEQENIAQLKNLLPSSSQLYIFRLISPRIDDDEIVSILPISNLRKLSLLTLRSFLIHIQQPTLITHLTISNCSLEQLLYQLFHYVPLLKYFNIEHITKYNRSIKDNKIINAVHLKQLIIGKFDYTLVHFAYFAKQIPNLTSLTISTDNDISMINANRWEFLIISSLPHLNIFKFKFTVSSRFIQQIPLCFTRFQSEFWTKTHQWYIHLLKDMNLYYFYTTPYLSNTFKLQSEMKRYTGKGMDDSNTFDNVTDLTMSHDKITDKCSFRFSNVISLKLILPTNESNDLSLQIFHIESLKMIVNLSHLKHLDISFYQRSILSGELLIILIESPQLSSIKIDPNDLILLYKDNELCKYVNKMIKKLNIYKYGHSSFDNLDELKKFCKIFSNIEQLICNINQPKRILFLLYRLSYLSTIHVYVSSLENQRYFTLLFLKTSRKLKNFALNLKYIDTNAAEVFISIDKGIN